MSNYKNVSIRIQSYCTFIQIESQVNITSKNNKFLHNCVWETFRHKMLCVKLDSIYIAAEKNICRMLGNDKLRVEKLKAQFEKRRCKTMSNNSGNHLVIPAAREAMDKFKMEAASEVGVNLKNGYNGELTARQAGSVGGQMVKKMIEAYENGLK